MANGYFQLFVNQQGTYLRVVRSSGGAPEVDAHEIKSYLDNHSIPYDLGTLNQGLSVALSGSETQALIPLCAQAIRPVNETYKLTLSPDKMVATARFYPPSFSKDASAQGARISENDFLHDISFQNISHGLKNAEIKAFFEKPRYMTDWVVAEGTAPRQGSSAHIEYLFNTDVNSKPTLKEDGSVDFFSLNNINHCSTGQLLARLHPEDKGDAGHTVLGETIRPHEVKSITLRKSKHVSISEDKLSMSADVDGHVTLVDGQVFVANVYTVDNVNASTGNIEFEGSVVVLGNVFTNFSVKAKGNIEVRGIVEGATLESGADIIINRGMKGMGRGSLKANQNVIAQFIENAKVEAGGYVSTDAILHSDIIAANEISVTSKKGFITGGRVCAGSLIQVKNLGSEMGSDTLVEVGVDPQAKLRIQQLQKRVSELNKEIKAAQPILNSMAQKIAQGVRMSPDQIKNVQQMTLDNKARNDELEASFDEMDALQQKLERSGQAQVIVTGDVYGGTLISIGDVSMTVRQTMSYCRFVKQGGEVKMTAI